MIRMVKNWDIQKDTSPVRSDWLTEQAFALVLTDARDIPFAEKLADALEFLRLRVH